MRKPDFNNLLKVLHREVPDRPVIFEFFLNFSLNERLTGQKGDTPQAQVDAFAAAGYDHCFFWGNGFSFPQPKRHSEKSYSANEMSMISSWEDFEKYPWPDVNAADYSLLDTVKIPSGMKVVVCGPCGVQENLISLMGYDTLCMALFDQPDLVRAMTDRIGATLVRHYERCLESDNVGAAISNDDWGFQQQPLLSPSDVREYILPWHTKIVKTIHDAGRPAIMHSCGNVYDCGLIEDVIEVCKFDARHSYEDKILPVEEAYERYHQRIAILGGIDVDFLCRKTPEEIYRRSKEMLERTAKRGGYALGSGNSIADYVPAENYFAMISAATGMKY